MATQPLKKKEPKKFNVNDFKSKLGFQQTKETSKLTNLGGCMPDAYSIASVFYVTTVVGH